VFTSFESSEALLGAVLDRAPPWERVHWMLTLAGLIVAIAVIIVGVTHHLAHAGLRHSRQMFSIVR